MVIEKAFNNSACFKEEFGIITIKELKGFGEINKSLGLKIKLKFKLY